MFKRQANFSSLFFTLFVCYVLFKPMSPALAQTAAGSSSGRLGNASSFPLSNYMSNPLSSSDPGAVDDSRHGRRQSPTGIGGSFLGTESVTSETAPATQQIYTPVLRNPATSQINNFNYYTSPQISPALRSVTDTSNVFSSGASSSFEQNFNSSPSSSGLDALPSFNRNTVIQGYSHGGRSWLGQ